MRKPQTNEIIQVQVGGESATEPSAFTPGLVYVSSIPFLINGSPHVTDGWAEIFKVEHIAVNGFRTTVFEVVCILLLFCIILC